MGKGLDAANEMNDIKNNLSEYPPVVLGLKELVNDILTVVDSSMDSVRVDVDRVQGLSSMISEHKGALSSMVDSDSATWAGWSTAESEVDSGTLPAIAPAGEALSKVHGMLMAVNGAIDEAVAILAGADQVAERAQAACNALPAL